MSSENTAHDAEPPICAAGRGASASFCSYRITGYNPDVRLISHFKTFEATANRAARRL